MQPHFIFGEAEARSVEITSSELHRCLAVHVGPGGPSPVSSHCTKSTPLGMLWDCPESHVPMDKGWPKATGHP